MNFSADQVALPSYPLKWYFSILSYSNWYPDPSPDGVYANLANPFETQYPRIIDNASEIIELMAMGSVRLICLNNFPYHTDSKLGCQSKIIPDISVYNSLKKHLIEEVFLPCNFGGKIAGFIEFDKCIDNYLLLIFIRKHLDLKSFKHNIDLVCLYIKVSQFIPSLSGEASLRWNGENRITVIYILGKYYQLKICHFHHFHCWIRFTYDFFYDEK